MIFVEISALWQALFIFKVLISLITSLELVSLKVKLALKPFLLVFTILEWIFRSSHPEVFLGKGVLKICSKFTGEHPCCSWCSSVNLLHIFKTPFTKNTSGALLLNFEIVGCLFKWAFSSLYVKFETLWILSSLTAFFKKGSKNSTQFSIGWDNFIFLSQIFSSYFLKTAEQQFFKMFGYQEIS